jgi:hypothetical protein
MKNLERLPRRFAGSLSRNGIHCAQTMIGAFPFPHVSCARLHIFCLGRTSSRSLRNFSAIQAKKRLAALCICVSSVAHAKCLPSDFADSANAESGN